MHRKNSSGWLLGVLLCTGLGLGGVVVRSRWFHPPPLPSAPPEPAALRGLRDQGYALFHQGRYREAGEVFEQGRREAERQGHTGPAIRFLNNLGGCRVAMFRYREGLSAYLEAKRLAQLAGDREAACGLAVNLSALYMEMGEMNGAVQEAEAGLALLGDRRSAYRSKILIHLARLRARTSGVEQAVPLFQQAIDEADSRGDFAAQAQAWNQLGYEWLRSADLVRAERALIEAYRIRILQRDKAILLSYRTLGMLRMAQGDWDAASSMVDRAFSAAADTSHVVPRWQLLHDRGRVRMAKGKLEQAVADFRAALESARLWRVEVLPADTVRVSLESGLQEIYSSFIVAAVRLYFHSRDGSLARQAFEAAEENRAASLRALLGGPGGWREKLPPEYGETLAQLRAAQVSSLAGETPAVRKRIERLQHELTEIEARAGLDTSAPQDLARDAGLLGATRRGLGKSEAYLSFHLAEPESYAWTVTRGRFAVFRLPSRTQIATQTAGLVRAVKAGSPDAAHAAARLYTELFSSLEPAANGASRWLLGLDDVLFDVPFPALVVGARSENHEAKGPVPPEGRPEFLIEERSVAVVPSAFTFASAQGGRPEAEGGPFVGLGDPVYNTADPRWRRGTKTSFKTASLEMARLPGSGREIRACAKAWDPGAAGPVLLEGPAVSRAALLEALRSGPAVVHVAAHVVAAQDRRALIALSLLPTGDAELLGSDEIAAWRVRPGLIVLSGCSSGLGEAPPGTGLMGLTRAWLAAGASSVIASRWPTPDDSGELFISFYRYLRSGSRFPDVALRKAQLDMLRSGTWRSLPRYWAAYFAVGKE
jgi:CHAT domain-containing protein